MSESGVVATCDVQVSIEIRLSSPFVINDVVVSLSVHDSGLAVGVCAASINLAVALTGTLVMVETTATNDLGLDNGSATVVLEADRGLEDRGVSEGFSVGLDLAIAGGFAVAVLAVGLGNVVGSEGHVSTRAETSEGTETGDTVETVVTTEATHDAGSDSVESDSGNDS